MKRNLRPCRYCGGNNIAVETWSSGGRMYMVKCNNPDCAVPKEGYPSGRNLEEVKAEWNRRNTKAFDEIEFDLDIFPTPKQKRMPGAKSTKQNSYCGGWIEAENPEAVTLQNICSFCKPNEDECGEYRECCYDQFLTETKNCCDVLPPDNNTGFYYDHQGVVKYAKENGKSVSDLSEAEKRRFLRKKSF